MKRILTIIGCLGFFVFAWSQMQGQRQTRPDRDQLHTKAIQAARDALDLDVSQWQWAPDQQIRHQLLLWQQRYAKAPIDFLVSGIDAQLVLTERAGRVLTESISADGRVTSLRLVNTRRNRKRDVRRETPRDEAARKAFRVIGGEFTERFTGPEEVGSHEYRWTAPSTDPRMRWQATVRVDADGVREATIRPVYDDAIRKEFQHSLAGMGDQRKLVGNTIAFCCIPVVAGMMIFAWMRKQIDRKAAITAGLLVCVPRIFVVPYSTMDLGRSPMIGSAFMVLLLSLLVASLIGVGQRAAREQEWNHWVGARLFLHRQWKARLIGEQLRHGFLWAGWIAAIPALIAVSGLFPGAYLGAIDSVNPVTLRTPVLNSIVRVFEIFSVALFATVLPLVSQRIPTRTLSLAVFWPIAIAALYVELPFIAGPEATLAAAALMSLAGIVLYLNHGLLAVLGLGKAMWLLWTAGSVFDTTSGPLSASFWAVVFSYAGIWIVAIVLAKKGTHAVPDDPVAEHFLSQRQRLKAEFSLAQRAQQRLLPDEPPALDGFSVAASCQPARDVGGDLYDYFTMPGGLTGFCVADVSGKGMPAALYMTLTKGLIAAASPESDNVVELASKVNRHLHIACKRKVFVTAIVAALDPQSRQVEFVRAGHNPALLFEAASKKARYLNPAGIGLGLAGPNLFDRGTKVGTVTLAPGDSLILYSDGVTEAMNERLDQFGEDRLKQSVERCAGGSAPYILSEIKKDLADFTGAEPAHDDVTLLVLQAQ